MLDCGMDAADIYELERDVVAIEEGCDRVNSLDVGESRDATSRRSESGWLEQPCIT